MNVRAERLKRPVRRPWGGRRRRVSAWHVALLWALLLAPLLRWGLPDRSRDELLFGGGPAWPAERYDAARVLQERRERAAGADTDLNPLARRDQLVVLTADEPARAEILRRYRLYTRQPDEMITFMALQRMQPRQWDFDPKLYQYGGGFIYLMAVTVGGAALVGVTQLSTDVGVYLEQPELFALFYVVARAVVLLLGAALLVGVWKLAGRAGGRSAAWLALLLLACTPVMITGALEAKPHVPAACLVVWATLSALDYHARGRRRDALRMGLQAGYAAGLVLTGIVAAALWPALVVARRAAGGRSRPAHRWGRARGLLAAAGLAALVLVITNPYIPLNLMFRRASLASNLDNSRAMYAGQLARADVGLVRVAELLTEGCGLGLLILGLLGLVVLLRARWRETLIGGAAAVVMAVIGVALGADKPAEYARFLILPVSLLCVAGGILLAGIARRRPVIALVAGGLALLSMPTPAYIRAFGVDAGGWHESRHEAGRYLQAQVGADDAVGVLQEPAPFAVPPLDFARRTVVWLPTVEPAGFEAEDLPRWLVFTADREVASGSAWWTRWYELVVRFPRAETRPSPIAWADKTVFVYRRCDGGAGAEN
jgi:hypothetical protein